jgi:cytoskeletal protein CcmA (bactofilin family)
MNYKDIILFILVIVVIYLIFSINNLKKDKFTTSSTDTNMLTESIKNLGIIAKELVNNGNLKVPGDIVTDGNLIVDDISINDGHKIYIRGSDNSVRQIYVENNKVIIDGGLHVNGDVSFHGNLDVNGDIKSSNDIISDYIHVDTLKTNHIESKNGGNIYMNDNVSVRDKIMIHDGAGNEVGWIKYNSSFGPNSDSFSGSMLKGIEIGTHLSGIKLYPNNNDNSLYLFRHKLSYANKTNNYVYMGPNKLHEHY